MKKLIRIIKKVPPITILFFLMSIVSLTFAWFGMIGIASANNMELEVLAWHISFDNDSTIVNFTSDDVLPGMDTYTHSIEIENKGDITATIKYKLTKLRILDEEYTEEWDIKNILLTYPFHITTTLNNSTLANGATTNFVFQVTWPYDQGNDVKDTDWGERVYQFKKSEKELNEQDSTYVIRKPLELEVELIARQEQTIDFKLGTTTKQANNGETWQEWILRQGGTSTQGGGLYLSTSCGKTETEITSLAMPFNADTRANGRYCTVYQDSITTINLQQRRARLTTPEGVIQKYNDMIEEGMDYKFTYDLDN